MGTRGLISGALEALSVGHSRPNQWGTRGLISGHSRPYQWALEALSVGYSRPYQRDLPQGGQLMSSPSLESKKTIWGGIKVHVDGLVPSVLHMILPCSSLGQWRPSPVFRQGRFIPIVETSPIGMYGDVFHQLFKILESRRRPRGLTVWGEYRHAYVCIEPCFVFEWSWSLHYLRHNPDQSWAISPDPYLMHPTLTKVRWHVWTYNIMI